MNKKIASVLFAAVCFLSFGAMAVTARAAQMGAVSAGEAVLEVSSQRLLWEKDADRVLPMASTTKILTALIIAEECDPEAVVCVPEEAVGVEGSSVYLVAGEKLTVRDLLYGLMLRSGNDCAETLALYHSGSIRAFAGHMNERARQLGAGNSHFCNPHGLPAEGHCTTAADLAKIAAHALQNELFSEIVSARSWRVEDGGCGYARLWNNKNKMLSMYDGADGVKTGYTKEAGRCLVTSATRGGMRLVSVVLDSPSMYERSSEILDSAFSRYSMRKIFDAQSYEPAVDTEVEGKTCRARCEKDFYYPLAEEETGAVRVEEQLPARLRLPVRQGDAVGEIKICFQNQLIFSQKIVSIEDKEKSYFDILRELTRNGRRKSKCESTNISPNAESPAGGAATS